MMKNIDITKTFKPGVNDFCRTHIHSYKKNYISFLCKTLKCIHNQKQETTPGAFNQPHVGCLQLKQLLNFQIKNNHPTPSQDYFISSLLSHLYSKTPKNNS